MTQPIEYRKNRSEWQALHQHQQSLAGQTLRDLFAADSSRKDTYNLQAAGIHLDYSRQWIDATTLKLLDQLARASDLGARMKGLFSGDLLNSSEKRAALHTALRDNSSTPILVDGKNVKPLILAAREKMRAFTERIHHGAWLGATAKPIRSIVTIGIGGSLLGPKLTCAALKDSAITELQFHFVSTPDDALRKDILEQIDPETTLFIVSSKTFSTLEPMTNARAFATWMQDKYGNAALSQHFIAITANPEKALAFGIPECNIFPIWDWVGGRYSIWSAIGLPLMLMIGSDAFEAFLMGAYEMDRHFQEADFTHNMPVLLALLGVWNVNCLHATAQAIIPYSYRLRYLPAYLQQADMESNGKSVSVAGEPIRHLTGPVIFGEEGCNGQHAYHQLLHQGNHFIPTDFILIGDAANRSKDPHHAFMQASGLSQADALMLGKTYDEARDALLANQVNAREADRLAKHQVIQGNKPSNVVTLSQLSPSHLGSLLALYEHKIFVQGVIWDINSFDQWGVELGKQLLPDILQRITIKDSKGEEAYDY